MQTTPRIVAALAACLAFSACQSTKDGPVDLGIDSTAPAQNAGTDVAAADPGRITDVELRAFCPRVELREGTAFYNTYERGKKDDRTAIIYQASIADTTRSCVYNTNDTVTMTVAAAGRVVPGPKGKDGAITMPIRVVVLQGNNVLYSQLHKQQVQISTAQGATQFVFTDPNVVIPKPTSTDYKVLVGYDEGPYNTP